MRWEVDFIPFTLQKYCFNFETYEKPPSIHDVGDVISTWDNLKKAIVSIDNITMKSQLNSNNVWQLNESHFLPQN